MKRLLIAMAISLMCVAIQATPVWFMKTDTGREFLVSSITSVASELYSSEFYLLLNDERQVGPFRAATFELKENTAIGSITDDGTQMVAVGGDLTLSNLKKNSRIALYDMGGAQKFEITATSGSLTLPVASCAPGVYVLVIDSSSYKILVK